MFMNLPFFIYQILIITVISFLFIKKSKFYIFSTIFFLALFLVEYRCYELFHKDQNTNVIYNWWFPIEFVFYAFFLIQGNYNNRYFKLTMILSLLYLLFVLLYNINIQHLRSFATITYQIGELFLIFLIIIRIKEVLRNEFLENPFKNPIVWLIIGLIFSNLGSLMHLSAANYLESVNNNLLSALRKLNIFLTTFLYCCIIIYFYFEWKRPKLHIL